MAFGEKSLNKVGDNEWFFKEASKTLNWEDLSDDIVMDIGCGFGDSSTTFLKLFPNVQKVVAIDFQKRNIEEALANNPHEKVEYEVADIQNGSTLAQWEGKISKAISTFTFNTLSKMEDGFKNVWNLLQPEGEAALLIACYEPEKFRETLYLNEEWKPYLSQHFIPEHIWNNQKMTDKDYQSVAMSVGFEVVECKKSERIYSYVTEKDFIDFVFRKTPKVKTMNPSVEMKFKAYIQELILQFYSKTENGKICIRNSVLSLLLRRPQMTA